MERGATWHACKYCRWTSSLQMSRMGEATCSRKKEVAEATKAPTVDLTMRWSESEWQTVTATAVKPKLRRL